VQENLKKILALASESELLLRRLCSQILDILLAVTRFFDGCPRRYSLAEYLQGLPPNFFAAKGHLLISTHNVSVLRSTRSLQHLANNVR